MEDSKILPLGSIVYLKEGNKKVMIIARGLVTKSGDGFIYFDYGGVPYPEGMVDDQLAYFQADAITKVIFEGFSDYDEEATAERIKAFVANHPEIPHGNVEELLGRNK